MWPCLLVALAVAPTARAQAPGADADGAATATGSHAPPPVELTRDDQSRLDGAVRQYHAGQHDLALSLLAALLQETAEDPVAAAARVYMGEIFFVQGNEDGAREAFELALRSDPALRLDPFQHPPDVCAFFEIVKADGDWRQPTPLPVPIEPPPPLTRPSPLSPLGIAQFRQGRTGAGTALAISQSLTCGASALLGGWLLIDRRTSDASVPGVPNFDDQGHRLWPGQTLRTRQIVQLSATGACYLAYGAGVADAAITQKRRVRARMEAGAAVLPAESGPDEPGVRLGLRGSF
ncbi:MAG: hypothetical protein H6742_06585 [Alphaproteobacteria bacterium]|nr:hypothetical protein [Alphaproteobacteria bacterium]